MLLCLDGFGEIAYCVFLPAGFPVLSLTGKAQLLDIRG